MVYEEPTHIRVFRRWYREITSHINVKDMVGCLMSSECLAPRDLERITIKCDRHGQTEAAEILMTSVVLRNPDPDCFEHFMKALEATNNEYLAEQIRLDYQYFLDYKRSPGQAGFKKLTRPVQPASISQPQTHVIPVYGQPSRGDTNLQAGNPQMAFAAAQVDFHPDDDYLPTNAKKPERFVPCIDKADLGLDFNERIGRGKFGIVYPGTHKGTKVAVKEIMLSVKRSRSQNRDDTVREQVNKEFQVNCYVIHNNVALLLAYALERDALYLVFEMINGHNLEQITFEPEINMMYRLDRLEKLYLTGQLCQAVSFLHHCEPMVIHGDLKPSNMMVTRDKSLAKLCDLGLSKLRSQTAATTTGGHWAVGTPMYMPPEMMIDQQVSTTRSDVWSLGASLYEVFFEEAVWDLDEDDQIKEIQQILKANSRPALVEKPDPRYKDVAEIIGQCMVYENKERLTSMDVLKRIRSVGRLASLP